MPTDPVAGQPEICFCQCGFATDDPEWFESHQRQHDLGRLHDVDAYTVDELEQVRRGLAASLALVRPNSPARIPILAQLAAIDVRLAQLAAGAQTALRAWRARGTWGRRATFKGRE
jgi:hypothetical protein